MKWRVVGQQEKRLLKKKKNSDPLDTTKYRMTLCFCRKIPHRGFTYDSHDDGPILAWLSLACRFPTAYSYSFLLRVLAVSLPRTLLFSVGAASDAKKHSLRALSSYIPEEENDEENEDEISVIATEHPRHRHSPESPQKSKRASHGKLCKIHMC
jgi:hypothetical protein